MAISGARSLVIVAIGSAAIAACKSSTFTCVGPDDCSGGMCQATGYCSFPDDDCPSHQRYGDHAASGYAGTCVGSGSTGTDASGSDGGTTMRADSSTSAELSSGEGNPDPDLPGPTPECIELDFDVVPLPGWAAFSDHGTAAVSDGRLIIDLSPSGAASAGIERASTDVALRRFAVEVASAPDPTSAAALGLVASGDGVAYGVLVRGGSVLATLDDGSGQNVLASMPYGDTAGLTLELVLGSMVEYRFGTDALGEMMLAVQPTAVDVAQVTLSAVSPPDNRVDAGTIEIERVQDCPAEASSPRSPAH